MRITLSVLRILIESFPWGKTNSYSSFFTKRVVLNIHIPILTNKASI